MDMNTPMMHAPKKREGGEVPKGKAWWALVIAFTVVVAALFYGLWLIRPHAIAQILGS